MVARAGGTRAVGHTGRGVGPSPSCPRPGARRCRRGHGAAGGDGVLPLQQLGASASGLPFLPAPTSFNSALRRAERRSGRRAPGAARRQRPAAGKTKGSHVLRAAWLPGAPGESARPRPAGAWPRGGGWRWGGTCRVRDGVFKRLPVGFGGVWRGGETLYAHAVRTAPRCAHSARAGRPRRPARGCPGVRRSASPPPRRARVAGRSATAL